MLVLTAVGVHVNMCFRALLQACMCQSVPTPSAIISVWPVVSHFIQFYLQHILNRRNCRCWGKKTEYLHIISKDNTTVLYKLVKYLYILFNYLPYFYIFLKSVQVVNLKTVSRLRTSSFLHWKPLRQHKEVWRFIDLPLNTLSATETPFFYMKSKACGREQTYF